MSCPSDKIKQFAKDCGSTTIPSRVDVWVEDAQIARLDEGIGGWLKSKLKGVMRKATEVVSPAIYKIGRTFGKGVVTKRMLSQATGYMMVALVDGIKESTKTIQYTAKRRDVTVGIRFGVARAPLHDKVLSEMDIPPLEPRKLDPAREALDKALKDMCEQDFVVKTIFDAVKSTKPREFWNVVGKAIDTWQRKNPDQETLPPDVIAEEALPYELSVEVRSSYDCLLLVKLPVEKPRRWDRGRRRR